MRVTEIAIAIAGVVVISVPARAQIAEDAGVAPAGEAGAAAEREPAPAEAVEAPPDAAATPEAPAPRSQAAAWPAPASAAEPAPEIPLIGVGPEMPPSTDPGMYPPLRPATRPRPYVELHGFAALWLTPVTDEAAPQHATETLRLRFAVARIDAHPVPQLHLITRLALNLPNPLLDASVTWTELPFLNVTFGQFRLPLGAAATTLAPQLVMLDRPGYVYAMTKATFRDLGFMFGTGEEGLFGGVLHYRAGVVSGNGRILEGDPTLVRDARDLLWFGRAIVDVGPLLGRGTRLALGGEIAWTRDPALDTTDPAAARASAANFLGRVWAPIDRERETMLAGADLTLSISGVWAQLEWLFLESRPTDGTASRRSTGGSLEVAYTLPWRIEDIAFQLAARGEIVDPDLDRPRDAYGIATGGLNVMPLSIMRLSVFGGATFYTDAASGEDRVGGELSMRAAVAY